MYIKCDADGNEYLLSDLLVDYDKDNKTISLIDQQTAVRGRSVTLKSTAGLQTYCQWKDSFTPRENLSSLKVSHQVQTAEFTVAQGIDHKPAFNWYVKDMLKETE